jgi:hypothetical protein
MITGKKLNREKTPPISPHRNPVKENMFIADCSSQNSREEKRSSNHT